MNNLTRQAIAWFDEPKLMMRHHYPSKYCQEFHDICLTGARQAIETGDHYGLVQLLIKIHDKMQYEGDEDDDDEHFMLEDSAVAEFCY